MRTQCTPVSRMSLSSIAAEMRLRLKYEFSMLRLMHAYEVRPRKDKRGVFCGFCEIIAPSVTRLGLRN
jgi:hypothetical protein